MLKYLFVILISLLSALQNLFAQEIDSISIYELEPAHITSTKDDIDITTLNYFATTKRKMRNSIPIPIGNLQDSSNNYGIQLKTNKKNNNLFIMNATFLIFYADTINTKNQKFYVLIKNDENKIQKIELTPKNLTFNNYPYYLLDQNQNSLAYLVNITFETMQIAFSNNDELYFIKEDYPITSRYTTVMVCAPFKKDKSYIYKDNKINPIKNKWFNDYCKQNPVWQVRLKYYEYYKEE